MAGTEIKASVLSFFQKVHQESQDRQSETKEIFKSLSNLHRKMSDPSQSPLLLLDSNTAGFNEATETFRREVFGKDFDSMLVLKEAIGSTKGDGKMIIGLTNNGYVFIFPSWDMPRSIIAGDKPEDPGIGIDTENGKFEIRFRNKIDPRNSLAEHHGLSDYRVNEILYKLVI